MHFYKYIFHTAKYIWIVDGELLLLLSLGFNGAETNCGIAHILGILLMISYWFAFYFSDIIVVCTVSISIFSDKWNAM